MIRIVGVQRSAEVSQEFVLLQNQGNMKVSLRGHALVADMELLGLDGARALHLLCDDVDVLPGAYVLVRTCPCKVHWTQTADGHLVYYTTMRRHELVWSECEGAIHLLRPQHSYCERSTIPALS